MGPRFILASGSPRRRQLLGEAGYEFEVLSPPVDEVAHGWLTIRELTIWNAARKAARVSKMLPDAVVLAADTLVAIDGDVPGKPRDLENAVKFCAGSADAPTKSDGGPNQPRRDRAFAQFPRDVASISETRRPRDPRLPGENRPLDKAGAYAAQGRGAEIIGRIEGSYSNVVGLPMEETVRVLRDFGVTSRP